MNAGRFLSSASSILHKLEDGLLLSLILAAVLLALTQIVLRNTGADALVWADQALSIGVLWIAMVGALVASREKNHIAIDLVSRFASAGKQRFIQAITHAATAACCAIAAWFGGRFVLEEREFGEIAFLNIPLWLCEAIIPVTLGLIALRYALYFLQQIFGRPA